MSVDEARRLPRTVPLRHARACTRRVDFCAPRDGRDAPDQDVETLARARVRKGLALFGAGDPSGALLEFREVIRLVPQANLPHRYAAQSYAALKLWPEAVAEYEAYLAIDPNVEDAKEVETLIREAKAAQMGSLMVRALPQGSEIVLDGRTILRNAELSVLSPGIHSITVKKDGYTPHKEHVEVAPSKTFDLLVTLERAVDLPKQESYPLRRPAVVLGVAGAAGLLAAFTLDMTWVRGAVADAKAAPTLATNYAGGTASGGPPNRAGAPTNAIADARTAAHRAQYLTLGLYGLSGAALLGGGILFLAAPAKVSTATISVTPTLGGISAQGTF